MRAAREASYDAKEADIESLWTNPVMRLIQWDGVKYKSHWGEQERCLGETKKESIERIETHGSYGP